MEKRAVFASCPEWASFQQSSSALGVDVVLTDAGCIVLTRKQDDGNGETLHLFEPDWNKFEKHIWLPILQRHVEACAKHKLKISE